ncbi:hypothetical protein [Sinorhizobium terangae]|uniref:hypothetical protein n=1 Tax=Sinorhizobium terangae TaxID=110322 RepID=UPI0024B14F0E|nr:hypothetical protein [Sinorhizobium terangae]WFU50744.1 hypothetical protein QA637_19100 [Sinorhizobium terangae]
MPRKQLFRQLQNSIFLHRANNSASIAGTIQQIAGWKRCYAMPVRALPLLLSRLIAMPAIHWRALLTLGDSAMSGGNVMGACIGDGSHLILPGEFEMLRDALEISVQERNLPIESEEAKELAARLVELYHNGVRDLAGLRAMAKLF